MVNTRGQHNRFEHSLAAACELVDFLRGKCLTTRQGAMHDFVRRESALMDSRLILEGDMAGRGVSSTTRGAQFHTGSD